MWKVIAVTTFLYIGLTFAMPKISDIVSERINDKTNETLDADFKYLLKNFQLLEKENLESILKQINDDNLYENPSQKDNINERSYIYIQGSKYKIPFVNANLRTQVHRYRMGPRKKYRTFVSNIDTADFGKFEDTPVSSQAIDLHVFKDIFSDFTNSANTYYSTKDNIPHYKENVGTDVNRELAIMTNKVNMANGIMDLQLKQYLKMKNGFNKPPPQPTSLGKNGIDQHSRPALAQQINTKQEPVKIDKQFDDVSPRNRPMSNTFDYTDYRHYPIRTLPDPREAVDNSVLNDNKNNKIPYREFIELMKSPILRPNPVPRGKPKDFNQFIAQLRPYYGRPKSKNVKQQVPEDNNNYTQTKNAMRNELNKKYIEPKIGDNNEDASFEDPRLIKTIEEIKQLDSLYFDNNRKNSNIRKRSKTATTTARKKKHVRESGGSNHDCHNHRHLEKSKHNCTCNKNGN